MDLFDYMRQERQKADSPLASRMRPRTLDEVVGQEHILGKDKLLSRAVRADRLGSMIFYGPPGTGKTTLAMVIANTTKADFEEINASAAGKKDMEEVIRKAKDNLGMYGRKTILFIDEIHRFNKSQQDYLLPFVEDGTVILIGATTENPFFEINNALISRSVIYTLRPLSAENIRTILNRAVTDPERGLGSMNVVLEDDAAAFLSDAADGDARKALNALEIGALTTARGDDGKIHISLPVAEECIQKRAVRYDRDGDNHYDIVSAFIKSMRGSDPDAAVFYLARMMAAGEDPAFIARRIMICACEDVGLADPQAIQVAAACSLAAERVGFPEARIILADAAIYVACAPKSNAVVKAISEAEQASSRLSHVEVPAHLRDTHYKGSRELGAGGYRYAHDYTEHFVRQQYLPDAAADMTFYHPGELGYEKKAGEWLKHLRERKEPGTDETEPGE